MALYKTAISFGLVHIPVKLNPVITNNDTSFNLLHKKCETRIKYQKYCPHCKKEVMQTDIIKGYEYNSNEYVTIDNTELEKIKTKNDKLIEIIAFVDLESVDPLYFEKSYYLETDTKNKAFGLFKKALEMQSKVAIAKTVLGSKNYYVIIRFGVDNIIMSTLYYKEELKQIETVTNEEYSEKEVELALKLIESMSGEFKPEEYIDEYQNKLKSALEDKIAGREIKPLKESEPRKITDLMSALQESLKKKKVA